MEETCQSNIKVSPYTLPACRFSVFDVIRVLNPQATGAKYAAHLWSSMSGTQHFQGEDFSTFKFTGQGQRKTPVATLEGVLKIIDHFDTPMARQLKAPQRELFMLAMRGGKAPSRDEDHKTTKKHVKVCGKPRKIINKQQEMEREVARRIAQDDGGTVEVITPVGRIDVLTATKIIEVKRVDMWKHALGQVLAYSLHVEDRECWIHLFGSKDLMDRYEVMKTHIGAACSKFNVRVKFETSIAMVI